MNLQLAIQPISYLKAHAADLVESLARDGQPLIVTQNGKAKLVVQDIASYEATQETLALLRLVAQGRQEIDAGKAVPAKQAFAQLRARRQSKP